MNRKRPLPGISSKPPVKKTKRTNDVILPNSVDCVVTSLPSFIGNQNNVTTKLGYETHPTKYIKNISRVFEQVYTLLKPTGTMFLIIKDSVATKDYPALKDTEISVQTHIRKGEQMLLPAMLAIELGSIGFFVKQDIIRVHVDARRDRVHDAMRFKGSHEYILFLTKAESKFSMDITGAPEPSKAPPGVSYPAYGGKKKAGGDNPTYSGRVGGISTGFKRRRDVWFVRTQNNQHTGNKVPHIVESLEWCIKTGCPPNGTVLDPFPGSGMTKTVANMLGRKFIAL